MRAVAIPMILLMLSASFAGCTSGDPDGDGTSGIDMEILNEMIDDNLQDFINNTSVTVNQEIHYHNNTTSNYQFAASDMTNNSGYRGQALFSVDYEFTIPFNSSGGHIVVYEIEVPNGMGIFCINHGSNGGNTYPQAYRNLSQVTNTNHTWYNWGSVVNPNLYIDGFQWGCESSFNGGSGDKIMQLTIDNSFENYGNWIIDEQGLYHFDPWEDGDVVDFRLVWTYILVPVISDNDGGVQ